jgi:hypothetical protein
LCYERGARSSARGRAAGAKGRWLTVRIEKLWLEKFSKGLNFSNEWTVGYSIFTSGVHRAAASARPFLKKSRTSPNLPVQSRSENALERIPQRELNGAWAAVDVSNLAKVRVGHAGIRLLVGSDVKGIEEVPTELDAMFAVDRKTLFHGHIDVLERRTGERGRANIAEVVR